jgi:hypothetical protein
VRHRSKELWRVRALSLCAAAFGWAHPIAVIVAAMGAAIAAILVTNTPAVALLVAFVTMPVVIGALAIVRGRERREAIGARAGISLAREPDVARLVAGAAAAIGVAEPAVVRVTLGAEVAVAREQGADVLNIGACWLTAATRPELTVAVAHALALQRAGTGSRRERALDAQLRRAGNLVADGRAWRVVWGGYVRVGAWLRDRARARARRWPDLVCAQAYGVGALDGFLRAAFRQDLFTAYWVGDVEPCLSDGFAPPILGGWDGLLAEPWFCDRVADDLAAAQLTRRSDAVASWASPDVAADGRAIELSTPVDRLERDLLAATYPDAQPETLVDIDWHAVGSAVWLPRLRRHATRFGAAVMPVAVRDLGTAVGAAVADDDELRVQTIAVLLALALVEAGWRLEVRVGSEIELHHEELSVLPISLCQALGAGTRDGADWRAFAEDAGIGDIVIGPTRAQLAAASTEQASWLPRVAPPARGAVTLVLARPPRRVRHSIYLAMAVLLGLPAGIAMIVAAAFAPTAAGAVLAAAFGVAMLVALGILVKVGLPAILATGTVTISADGIRIEHSGLLKEPFELAHDSVRAVVVDDGLPSTERFAVNATPFPVPGAASDSFLWVRDQEVVVPCLAAPSQDPNVALLLEQPVLGPRVRRATSMGPRPGEALAGLLLCVADADAARAAFRPWDVMRPALFSDAAHVYRGFPGRSPDPSAPSPTE